MKKIISYVRPYWIGILISLTFFIVGMITLSDYGINVDESIHFERGNAYLNLFLTGKTKYSSSDFSGPRISEWKYKTYDAEYFIKNDSGHPPLNGILAAATNRIFFEKLGIVGDLQSYHMFELFVSSTLVFLVFAILKNRYGTFAGTIASLSTVLYPLFYGESHFNIKDPLEASFFAFTVYFLYLGVEKARAKYFLISSLFCALAFGTKFNIIFLPFIFIPYFIVRRILPFLSKKNKKRILINVPKSIYLSILFYPFIVIGIHFLSRPFLWQDPISRFMQILQFYKDIGTGIDYQSVFIFHGFNVYPFLFVGISTPIVILAYFLIGVFVALLNVKREDDKFSLLILLWLGVTLLRVSLPGTSIYGGVRQIMEYIPSMTIIAGIGAYHVRNVLGKVISRKVASVIIIATFFPLVITLIKMHPNENLFMNSLIGGLKGATEKKITGVGETMGNSYLQGIWWLNENAEKNARFGFPEGLGSNFPPQFVRKDIKFGPMFSGMKRGGEYMMEMFSVDFPFPRYHINYLENFLEPVYVKYVDGVPVLKIWKNDLMHTKPGFANEVQVDASFNTNKTEGSIEINLKTPAYLTKIVLNHGNSDCLDSGNGQIIYTSPDGKQFSMPDDLYLSQGPYAATLQTPTHFLYFFTAEKVKSILILPEDSNLCLLQVNKISVFALKDLK